MNQQDQSKSVFEIWRKRLKKKWFTVGLTTAIIVPVSAVGGLELFGQPIGIHFALAKYLISKGPVLEYLEQSQVLDRPFRIKGGSGQKDSKCLIKLLPSDAKSFRPAINCELPGVYRITVTDGSRILSSLFENSGSEVRLSEEVSASAKYQISKFSEESTLDSQQIFVAQSM